MTDAELDALIKEREKFDRHGVCLACRGDPDAWHPCGACGGELNLTLGPVQHARLIDHVVAMRKVVGDLCEESAAVREVVRLRGLLERVALPLPATLQEAADDVDARIELVRAALRGPV